MMSQFWLLLLEAIYLPVYNFVGYDPFIAIVIWALFVSLQIWIFWHFFFKPFIYVCKLFINIINKNTLFREVEVDEENSKNCR